MKSEDKAMGQPSESLLRVTSDYHIQGHLFAYGNRRFTEGKLVGKKAGIKEALIRVGREARRTDGTTYLVPDYKKYRQALKDEGIE